MNACPFCSEVIPAAIRPAAKTSLVACSSCLNPYTVDWNGAVPECKALPRSVDLRTVAPPGSIGAEILRQLRKTIDDLPVLPEVAHRVMTVMRDPNCSIRDIADIIKEDAVIALRVLRTANSAMFGGLSEIKELATACTRLGMRTTANIVQAAASGNVYSASAPEFQDRMRQLWRHNIAAAYCANEIGRMLAEPRADELFIAGLVHDIGKVGLLEVISRSRAGVVAELAGVPTLMDEVLENFHPIAGLHIVQHWNLATEFSVTTYCHEDPSLTRPEELLPLVHIVHLASRVALAAGYGGGLGEKDTAVTLLDDSSTAYLGLSDVKLALLRVDLADRLEPLFELLNPG